MPINLFCVPYAGGNMWAYRALELALPKHGPQVNVIGLELPGRGRRANEPLVLSLEDLADDVFRQVRDRAQGGAYALLGHSMGALLVLLAARRLRKAGLPPPEALFVSGAEAPSAQVERRRHLLPPQGFLDMLREMGGCPPEVLADRELLAFFVPVLRADFQAVETWRHVPEPPLATPITMMMGVHDEVTEDAARAWSAETAGAFRLEKFPGDHFFVLQHWTAIGGLVHGALVNPRAALQGVGCDGSHT
jgi:surfactin synthase thioesterase subunit